MTTATVPKTLTIDTTKQLAGASALADEMQEIVAVYTVISDPQTAEMAAQDLRKVKAKMAEVEETRLSITRPIDQAKTATIAAFAPYLDRLGKYATALDASIKGWIASENTRIERERAEAARLEQERLAELRAAEDAAREAGDDDAVEAAREAAEEVTFSAPPPVASVAKLSGVSSRANWKVRSIDLRALVQAAAKDDNLLAYLAADEKVIAGVARSMKDKTNIPGVVVWNDAGLTVRK